MAETAKWSTVTDYVIDSKQQPITLRVQHQGETHHWSNILLKKQFSVILHGSDDHHNFIDHKLEDKFKLRGACVN